MPVSTYRKKPIIVQAIQYTGDNAEEIARFTHGKAEPCKAPGPGRGLVDALRITTLEGVLTAPAGWWVIRGIRGEFYPCHDGIFRDTYEPYNRGHNGVPAGP